MSRSNGRLGLGTNIEAIGRDDLHQIVHRGYGSIALLGHREQHGQRSNAASLRLDDLQPGFRPVAQRGFRPLQSRRHILGLDAFLHHFEVIGDSSDEFFEFSD